MECLLCVKTFCKVSEGTCYKIGEKAAVSVGWGLAHSWLWF